MALHRILRTCVLLALVALTFALGLALKQSSNIQADWEGHGSVQLPVIMYHSILRDPSRWGPYVCSPDQLEQDLVFLQEQGYTAVSCAELLAYIRDPFTVLPPRPILLTFDDGFYNNFYYAYPLLEKYDMKAVFSVVGSYTQAAAPETPLSPMYDHLGYKEMRTLLDSGRVEIGNHSYALHKISPQRTAATKNSVESIAEYKQFFAADTQKATDLLKTNLDLNCEIYAYPYGLVSHESVEVLENMGYTVLFGCVERLNVIQKGRDLPILCRYNRPSGIGSAAFFAKIFP